MLSCIWLERPKKDVRHFSGNVCSQTVQRPVIIRPMKFKQWKIWICYLGASGIWKYKYSRVIFSSGFCKYCYVRYARIQQKAWNKCLLKIKNGLMKSNFKLLTFELAKRKRSCIKRSISELKDKVQIDHWEKNLPDLKSSKNVWTWASFLKKTLYPGFGAPRDEQNVFPSEIFANFWLEGFPCA